MFSAQALLVAASFLLPQDGTGSSGAPSDSNSAPVPQEATGRWGALTGVDTPPGMPWQRSLEDALALSKATGKPLLICVNNDGEPASDALARGRYRSTRFLDLVDGFIPVLASPIRHNPVDYTAGGRRILDPRFGRLVEREHIDHEPVLYARYFNGQRVAPRHVGVSPDGKILFDLFLLNDLSQIDRALEKHGKFGLPKLDVEALSVDQLLASRDAAAREKLEADFAHGGWEARRDLARAAFSSEREAQHPELVRLALYDGNEEVRLAGVDAVASNPVAGAEFLTRAFMVAVSDSSRRSALSVAVSELAQAEDETLAARGTRLKGVFSGLEVPAAFGVEEFVSVLEGRDLVPEQTDIDLISRDLERIDRELSKDPENVSLHSQRARLSLSLARIYITSGGGNASFPLQDALDATHEALKRRPDAVATGVFARSSFLMNNQDEALQAARPALAQLRLDPVLAASELARDVLDVVIRVDTQAIYDAITAEEPLDPERVRDAVGAYRILAAHPMVTPEELDAGLTFLETIEAFAEQAPLARIGVLRFPDSGRMHQWLRYCVQRDSGVEALSRIYLELPVPEGFEVDFMWHAGLSQVIAGETFGRDGRIEDCLRTYRAGLDSFARVISQSPEYAGSSNHYRVLAHAGMAHVFLGLGGLDESMAELRAAALLLPSSFAEKDSLGRMPRETVKELQTALRREGRSDEARSLEADLRDVGVRL